MKKCEINGQTHIIADKGMRVTNGDGVYAFEVVLSVGASPDGYKEIPEEEYRKILEKVAI